MAAPNRTEADTESKILEAAHRVFTRKGVAAARTQEIADEAGVNKALLHYYFRTKEKLSDAVFVRAAQEMFPGMVAALSVDLPLRDRIQRAIDVEMDALETNPFLPGYILCELRARPDQLKELLAEGDLTRGIHGVREVLQDLIDAEVAQGRMRLTRADELMVALMSMIVFPHAASHMLEVGAGLNEDEQRRLAEWRRRELADFLLRGFAP